MCVFQPSIFRGSASLLKPSGEYQATRPGGCTAENFTWGAQTAVACVQTSLRACQWKKTQVYLGVSKNRGFSPNMKIMENPIETDDLGGKKPYFWKHPPRQP